VLQACKFIEENLAIQTETLGKNVLINCASTAMSSKIIGAESEFFSQMAVDAMQTVKIMSEGKAKYPVKAINVLKAHGKSARESQLLKGYALSMGRASQGMPKRVTPAKIACLDMNLQKQRMHMGIQVTWLIVCVILPVCLCPGPC
jgi:T-complex protein 1 subunit alpha